MKKEFKTGILAITLGLFTITTNAQPALQWTRTLQLEGTWQGDVTATLGTDVFLITYYMDFKSDIDGNALTMYETFSHPDIGELKGLNLIGYNPTDDMIHWFSADNFGTAHEHTGSWSTNKKFHMEHTSLQGGLPFVELIDVKLKANNTKMDIELVATVDGVTVQVLSGTLTRQQGNNNRLSPVLNESGIVIYPNPSVSEVNIECDETIDEIIVTNEQGQLVSQVRPGKESYTLKLETAGIYFVKVNAGEFSESRKIIITK